MAVNSRCASNTASALRGDHGEETDVPLRTTRPVAPRYGTLIAFQMPSPGTPCVTLRRMFDTDKEAVVCSKSALASTAPRQRFAVDETRVSDERARRAPSHTPSFASVVRSEP